MAYAQGVYPPANAETTSLDAAPPPEADSPLLASDRTQAASPVQTDSGNVAADVLSNLDLGAEREGSGTAQTADDTERSGGAACASQGEATERRGTMSGRHVSLYNAVQKASRELKRRRTASVTMEEMRRGKGAGEEDRRRAGGAVASHAAEGGELDQEDAFLSQLLGGASLQASTSPMSAAEGHPENQEPKRRGNQNASEPMLAEEQNGPSRSSPRTMMDHSLSLQELVELMCCPISQVSAITFFGNRESPSAVPMKASLT